MTSFMNGVTDALLAGASEKVLKQITELYETGLGGKAPGATGLKGIADHPLIGLGKQIRKPRKKIRYGGAEQPVLAQGCWHNT